MRVISTYCRDIKAVREKDVYQELVGSRTCDTKRLPFPAFVVTAAAKTG
jgi:hypothetical protein